MIQRWLCSCYMLNLKIVYYHQAESRLLARPSYKTLLLIINTLALRQSDVVSSAISLLMFLSNFKLFTSFSDAMVSLQFDSSDVKGSKTSYAHSVTGMTTYIDSYWSTVGWPIWCPLSLVRLQGTNPSPKVKRLDMLFFDIGMSTIIIFTAPSQGERRWNT